jgi:hypothetical protein
MNHSSLPKPGRGLRALDLAVNGLHVLLIVATAIAAPLLVVAAIGKGSTYVSGVLDAPYSLAFDDGRSITVDGDTTTYENFPIGEESRTLHSAPTVTASLRVPASDLDTRAMVIAIFGGWLAAAWLGLVNLRRLVRSARNGGPFASENPRRLRWLGAAVLSVPIVTGLGNAIAARTIELDVPFSVSVDQGSWLTLVVVGVGLIALAEVFAEAARLREFEETTI